MKALGDVRFFDRDFRPILILPRYLSADWQISHRAYGTAELHFAKTKEIVELLTTHTYLFVQQGAYQGIVTGVRIEKDCAVFIRTPEWLLTKFSLWDFTPTQTTASAIACEMVETVLEGVPLILEGQDADKTDRTDFSVSRATDLLGAIKSCMTDKKTGFSLRFDTQKKQFIFRVFPSRQRDNLVFSEEFKTAYEMTYTKDLQQQSSGGVYYQKVTNCGDWNAEINQPPLYLSPDNFGKYYKVVAGKTGTHLGIDVKQGDTILCKDLSGRFTVVERAEPFPVELKPNETGIFAWRATLLADNTQDAEKELSQKTTVTSADGKTHKLSCGTDFELGDIIMVEFAAGKFSFQEKRIIEHVHIWENAGSFGCLPEMGSL